MRIDYEIDYKICFFAVGAMGEVGDWAKEFEEELAAEELAAGPDGSFDDEHDADMLPEEDAEPEPEEQEPEAAPPSASLSSGMSNAALQQWMQDYRDQAGNALFLTGSAHLEHVSMQRLYKDSQNDKSWKDVTMLVFDGDTATSLIFKMKVKAARELEHAANSKAAKRMAAQLAKAEAKKARLAEMQKNDVKGPEGASSEEPRKPTVNAFAQMGMGAGNQSSHWSQKQRVCVKLPRDWEESGSKTFRRYRDEPVMRERLAGWTLTTAGMPKPAGLDPDLKVTVDHPIFLHNKTWQFDVDSIGMSAVVRW